MKIKMVMILSACVVHNVYASSLDYGTRFDSSMREAAYALSSSVTDSFKRHPYLFGGAAALGTAAIMCRVMQSKKEVTTRSSSVSPEALSPFSDSEQTDLTPGILELVARSQKELTDEQKEIERLEEKAKRMEKIRIVRQVLKQEQSFVEGSYQALLIREKETGRISLLLRSKIRKNCRYELSLLDEREGNVLCAGLSEYLDLSKKTVGEKKLRDLIGLEDEASLDEGTLKALLNGIRGTIEPFQQD